ncbi:unnamed protein product [Prunus armeniaca]
MNIHEHEERSMFDSESAYDFEPNAFDGESSDDQRDSSNVALSFESVDSEDAKVKVVGKKIKGPPPFGRGKVLQPNQTVPLDVVPCGDAYASTSQYYEFLMGDTRLPDRHASYHSETSTSVTVVLQGNPRVPLGQPKRLLFGVDYLGLNLATEAELAKYRADYLIPDSVKWRISGPTESLSNPKDGEVVFFTNVLKQGVRLPLQPAVQRILAHLGYAPGQYNPNFWVALMGVIIAFGLAEEGEPSYKQLSYSYSVTKSKSADHGGWV